MPTANRSKIMDQFKQQQKDLFCDIMGDANYRYEEEIDKLCKELGVKLMNRGDEQLWVADYILKLRTDFCNFIDTKPTCLLY